jgi:quercetin 2,3-dioxygenase
MFTIIPSESRYHANFGWLDTKWHFSFADYFDPRNVSFSELRVFNDDIVGPGGGFDMHPHRNMEIITYMLEGTLEHQDSMGHKQQLRAGEVQVMSAGRGLTHSEYNASKTEPAHLLQLWIQPRQKNATPRWDQRAFNGSRLNRLLPVVSSGNIPDTLTIDQDAAIYVSTLDAGHGVKHSVAPNRHTYLFVPSGHVTVNGKELNGGDQARVENETNFDIVAKEKSDLILIDLP